MHGIGPASWWGTQFTTPKVVVAEWPDGKFVAISAADAGYPTAINSIEGAATWPTAKAAAEYLQVGADGQNAQGIEIHKITQITTAAVTPTATTVTKLSFTDPD